MRRSLGFTMVELLVTIAILAIVSAFAIPSMRDFIRRSNAASTANSLVTAVALGRSEALRRGAPVSICPSTTGTSCGTGTDWPQGWIVFSDDGVRRTVDGTDQVIQTFERPGGNPAFDKQVAAITYLPSGLRETGTGVPVGNCLEFKVANDGQAHRYVHLSVTGSARVGKGSCVQ